MAAPPGSACLTILLLLCLACAAPAPAPTQRSACALDPRVVVYNRLPKSGSTYMHALLLQLSARNNFTVMVPPRSGDYESMRATIDAALASGQRTVVMEHAYHPEVDYGDALACRCIFWLAVTACLGGAARVRWEASAPLPCLARCKCNTPQPADRASSAQHS